MTDIVRQFSQFADICKAVQQKAIELENLPDRRKRLRPFTTREVSDILGVSPSHLRNLVRSDGFPQGTLAGPGRRVFSIADIHAARAWLLEATGNSRYQVWRRPDLDEKLQVVTFVNFKGGSGKTTTSVHFAQYLALNGYRVLLVDLDPQGSATTLFGVYPDTDVGEDRTFAGWIRRADDDPAKRAATMVHPTYWPGLDLITASITLQHAEYELVGHLLRSKEYPFYRQLSTLLAHLEPSYDVVICDCRPDVGMLTINALLAATGLIVPIPPSMIDFASSGEFFRFMAEIAADFRSSLIGNAMNYDFVRILTSKYKAADKNQTEIVNWKHAFFQDALLEHPMVDTALMDSAGIVKETLYEYEPAGNRRTYERGLEAMNQVNADIEREILKVWGRTSARSMEAA